jgi:hypothetical protein
MRGLAGAVVFACISILPPHPTTAHELPDRTRVRDDIAAAQLNRQQSRTFKEPIARPAQLNATGERVGILFLLAMAVIPRRFEPAKTLWC